MLPSRFQGYHVTFFPSVSDPLKNWQVAIICFELKRIYKIFHMYKFAVDDENQLFI